MNFLKFIGVYTCLIVTIAACRQDDNIVKTDPIKEYESCCGAEAVEYRFSTGQYMYVPNSFTPNEDGVNDLWFPHFSSGLENIRAIFIFSSEDNTLIHQIYEYNLYPPGTPYGWDGRRSRNGMNLGDNSLYKGGFLYQIFFEEPVNVGNGATSFLGKACSILCDEDAAYFKDKEGCFFPVQVDTNGMLDKTILNGENNCFGN
jgi:hypothetical protein